jgi:hypothetical protein
MIDQKKALAREQLKFLHDFSIIEDLFKAEGYAKRTGEWTWVYNKIIGDKLDFQIHSAHYGTMEEYLLVLGRIAEQAGYRAEAREFYTLFMENNIAHSGNRPEILSTVKKVAKHIGLEERCKELIKIKRKEIKEYETKREEELRNKPMNESGEKQSEADYASAILKLRMVDIGEMPVVW